MRIIIITFKEMLMMNQFFEAATPEYDPELPNANAVMASLCCVAVQYASRPSLELAALAADLSQKLMAPQYAESKLVTEVAKRLTAQWSTILRDGLREQNELEVSVMPVSMARH
jgi:hypothetical protein